MGQDPKPTKRRRAQAPDLPMLPKNRAEHQVTPLHPTAKNTLAHQTRIPSGPGYDTQGTLPSLDQLMELIVGADPDGYFKQTAGDDGKSWFIAYKWQRGSWAGYYVMARVLRGELRLGWQLLAEKVLAVRSGVRKPTLDRYEG